jgi:hypothetical protein
VAEHDQAVVDRGRGGRSARVVPVALAFAAAWGGLLLVAAFAVPAYQGTSQSSSGTETATTQTLVGANGPGAALVLAVPLLVTGLVARALLAAGERPALPLAWALTAGLAAFAALAALSIGAFVLPAVVALAVACAASGRAREPVQTRRAGGG